MTASRKALIVVVVLIGVGLGLPWSGAVPTASAQTISVTAADPPTGEQGTLNLNVIIKGKGFKNGAKAKFYKAGTTDPDGVNVKSTKYVSSTQLLATIDIADWAALSKFDIQVANADGRTGKGTELFSVLAKKIDPCTLPDPEATASNFISYDPAPGYLDGNFGNGTGRVIGPRGFSGELGTGAAIQNISGESRIILAGALTYPCSNVNAALAVVRYLPNGSLDPSFGIDGMVTTAFRDGSAYAADVVVDRLNRIVAVGLSAVGRGSVPTAVRYNEDGSLDTSFGTGGVAAVPTGNKGSYDKAYAVVLQSDGKIVMAGQDALSGYLRVIRLNPNGTLDTSFNGTGQYVYTDMPGTVGGVATQWAGSEERIVVAGERRTHFVPYSNTGALWRFTSGGTLDSSFGTGGVVLTTFDGGPTFFQGVAVDGANRLVAVGYRDYYPAGPAVLAVARYDATGGLDPTFGTGGQVLVPSQTTSFGEAVAIQADGRVLVAGWKYLDAGSPPKVGTAAWRFTEAGALDTALGGVGWVVDPVVVDTLVVTNRVILQPDGTFLTVGYLKTGDKSIRYAFLARFWQ